MIYEPNYRRNGYRSMLTMGLIFSLFGIVQPTFLFFGIPFLVYGGIRLHYTGKK